MLPEFMNLLCKFYFMRAAARKVKTIDWLYRQTETTLLSQGGFSLLNAWAETGETLRSFSIKKTPPLCRGVFFMHLEMNGFLERIAGFENQNYSETSGVDR